MARQFDRAALVDEDEDRLARRPGFDAVPGEDEADAVRDAFLRAAGPASGAVGAALAGADGATRHNVLLRLQRERGNAYVQRVVSSIGDPPARAAGDRDRVRVPSGDGAPLPDGQRAAFERAFGRPLEQVRVHTGDQVDEAALALRADAFTTGSDIFVAGGRADQGHPDADRVLAHELAHVVQYEEGRVPPGGSGENAVSRTDDPLEQEAYEQEDLISGRVSQLRGQSGAEPAAARVAPNVGSSPQRGGAVAPASGASSLRRQSGAAAGWIARRDGDPAQGGAPAAGPGGAAATDAAVGAGPGDEQLLPKPPEPSTPLAAAAPPPPPAAPPAPPSAPPPPNLPPPPAAAAAAASGVPVGAAPAAAAAAAPAAPQASPNWATPDQSAIHAGVATSAAPAGAAPPGAGAAPAEVGAASGSGAAVAAAQADALLQDAQALAQSIEPAGEAAKLALTAEVARLTGQVEAEAAQARADLAAAYSAQQAAVDAQAQASLASIEQSRQQQQQAVSGTVAAERERLRGAHRTERQGAIDFVAGIKQATRAAGEAQAQRATAESERRATGILAEAQAVPTSGDQPAVEAQQKAVREIAERAAAQCRQTATDLSGRLRQEAEAYANNDYESGLQQFLTQLDQQLADAERAVDEFASQATAQVDAVAAQSAAAAQQMAAQSRAALDAERQSAEGQIQAWETQVPAALQGAGDQLRDALNAQLSPLASAVNGFGQTAATQIRGLAQADPASVEAAASQAGQDLHAGYDAAMQGLTEWQSGAIPELTATYDGLREQLAGLVGSHGAAASDVGGKIVQGMQQVAQAAATDMQTAATSFQTHLAASVDAASQKMASGGEQLRAKLQENYNGVVAVLTRAVDDALTSEDNLLADARAKMATSVTQIAGKYQELQAEAERRNQSGTEAPATRIHRGIWSSITGWWGRFTASIKKWFADTFGEFWGGLLYGILETLVIIVVGALAIWGLAAGIVALGLTTLSVGTVALIIGAVLLVIVVIPLMIYNRVQEYHQDNPGKEIGFWTGLGLGLLGIADLTGIPFIIEAAVGKRATGGALHGWERGYRLGQGIVMLAAAIFSAYKFLTRAPAPAEPIKGGGPPPEGGGGAKPVDPNAPPAVDPNAPPTTDPNAPPTTDPNAPPQVDPNKPPEPKPADPTLDSWRPGDPLPRAADAQVDPAKFTKYSMDPNNTNNNGKWKAFESVGYDVQNEAGRAAGAQDVVGQLRDQLPRTAATEGKATPHGRRFQVRTPLTGPNGRAGTLVSVWQFDAGSNVPRLITNWLEVH